MGTSAAGCTRNRVFIESDFTRILGLVKATAPRSGKVQGAPEGTLLIVDLLLELKNRVENGFGARRAAGNVDVDGDDLIAAPHDGGIVADAAGSGTSAHGDDPLGLGHLIVELADDGSHFLREAAGDDHQVGLTGRWAKDFGAEASEVKARSGHGHHLDGAAGQAKAERPNGTLARPVHGLVVSRVDDAFVLHVITEIVGLCIGVVFSAGLSHVTPTKTFSHSL